MTDYISREYVLKCMEDSFKNAGISAEAASKVRKWLYKAPAADVRPVVKCKECKYWKSYNSHHLCSYVNGAWYIRKDNDFCSRGEKAEEGE